MTAAITLTRAWNRWYPTKYSVSYSFFSSHGRARDLHSFPTRRSSDLRRELLVADRETRLAGSRIIEDRHRAGERTGLRSEEHTSELQSRQYLVCRLLLEKKK